MKIGAMRIRNPLQINDWEINKFLVVIIAAHLAMLVVTSLHLGGLGFSALRGAIGFIYLTFIPGLIILRLLRIHRLSLIENTLYCVGLSIVFLTLVGFVLNAVYSFFELSYPLGTSPLAITTIVILIALTIWSYYRDRGFSEPGYLEVSDILSPPALFLFLLPMLSVVGAYLVNYHHSNVILMILIALVALIVVLIAFGVFIPKQLYPLAVFMIAISLFYHCSLISPYLTGADVKVEYYVYGLTNLNLFWDSALPYHSNSVLSITMLPVMYSSLSGIEGTWVFKAIYPFFFALAPLGLYHVYQKQSDKTIAFLGFFYLVSISGIYTQMLSIAKQEVAVLFLVLMVMMIVAREFDRFGNRLLFILFSFGLVVSHYGISYLFIVFLIITFVATSCIPQLKSPQLKGSGASLTWGSMALFIVLALTWYMYAVSSYTFDALVSAGSHIYNNIAGLFRPAEYQIMAVVPTEAALPLRQVARVIYAMMPVFITVGIIKLLIKRRHMQFGEEYIVFSLIGFAILAVSFLTPWLTGMNFGRWYFFMILFLAPFAIIGGITVLKGLAKLFRLSSPYATNVVRVIGSVILVLFFLFSNGFIYELANEDPNSISLSQENIVKYGSEARLGSFYATIVPEQEVYSARWLSQHQDSQLKTYADIIRRGWVLPAYGLMREEDSFRYALSDEYNPGEDYVYLGYLNVRYGLAPTVLSAGEMWDVGEIYPLLSSKNKIYSNGGSEIFR